MNSYDKAHEKAIRSYINRIRAIMDKYTEEYCKHANSAEFDADKPFSFDDYPATLSKVKSLEAKMAKELQVSVEDGVADSWAMSNRKNDALVKSSLSAMALEGMGADMVRRYFNENRGALDAFKQRVVNGMNLSQRVWKITEQNMQDMEVAIDIALRDGTSAAQLSRKVRGLLNEPDKLFRRVRDEHGVLHLSKNAKAYHPGQGVYRSSYKNAIRLAGTEINMAYRTADHLRYQQLDFVVGIEILTSPTNHPDPDICDELKGKYPKDFKFTGWHPNCRCHVETILKTPEEMDADEELIINGQEPGTGSVNEVRDMPEQFERWLQDNEDRIGRAQSMPYFLRDNYAITRNADGTLAFERIVSQPAAPRMKSLLEIAEERHAARTPEQVQAIKERANQRNDAYAMEKSIRGRYEQFNGFDLDKMLPKFDGDYGKLMNDLSSINKKLENQVDKLLNAGVELKYVKQAGIQNSMKCYQEFRLNIDLLGTHDPADIQSLYDWLLELKSHIMLYNTNSLEDRMIRMMYDSEIAKTESAIEAAKLKIKKNKIQNRLKELKAFKTSDKKYKLQSEVVEKALEAGDIDKAEKALGHLYNMKEKKVSKSAATKIKNKQMSNTAVQTQELPYNIGSKPDYLVNTGVAADVNEAIQLVDAVNSFTYEWDWEIRQIQCGNFNFKSKYDHKMKDMIRKAELCEEFIRKSPKWNGGVTYRGIAVDNETLNSFLEKMNAGDNIDMLGTASFSTHEKVARSFATHNTDWKKQLKVVFRCNGRQNGTSILPFSNYADEFEILCSKDSRWKILSSQKIDDYFYFDIELM